MILVQTEITVSFLRQEKEEDKRRDKYGNS
jgi:hypothetical protein